MNIWRPIGYIFVGFGVVLLLVPIIEGYLAVSPLIQFSPELARIAFFAIITPWIMPASLSFVIGIVGLYVGSTKTNLNATRENALLEPNLERVNRLEDVVDNNFIVITKRLDKIEEQQKLASQNTLMKAKKD